jgi:hypothetical protein
MTLAYDSTLDDVAETAFRLYQRGRSYRTNRWIGTALCTVAFAVLAFLGFHSAQNINLPILVIVASAWGAGVFLFGYKRSIRRRIASYIASEMKGPWPQRTVYEIKNGKLTTTTSGVGLTFLLADLTAATEDKHYLQLTFGPKGLCAIPLRAFDDTDHKTAFLHSSRPLTEGASLTL